MLGRDVLQDLEELVNEESVPQFTLLPHSAHQTDRNASITQQLVHHALMSSTTGMGAFPASSRSSVPVSGGGHHRLTSILKAEPRSPPTHPISGGRGLSSSLVSISHNALPLSYLPVQVSPAPSSVIPLDKAVNPMQSSSPSADPSVSATDSHVQQQHSPPHHHLQTYHFPLAPLSPLANHWTDKPCQTAAPPLSSLGMIHSTTYPSRTQSTHLFPHNLPSLSPGTAASYVYLSSLNTNKVSSDGIPRRIPRRGPRPERMGPLLTPVAKLSLPAPIATQEVLSIVAQDGCNSTLPTERKHYHPKPPSGGSDWVMWVGNVPHDATKDEVLAFFKNMTSAPTSPHGVGASSTTKTSHHKQLATPACGRHEDSGVISVFLIPQSRCAFVNYESESALQNALQRFDGRRFLVYNKTPFTGMNRTN